MSAIGDRSTCEAVGERYHHELILDVRERTLTAIEEIASRMTPGMVEEDARKVAAGVLREAGLRKGWHGILVRFGKNTLCSYDEPSEHGVVLGADDIFLIDVGPILEGIEGDGGTTVAVGDDAEMHAAASDVRALWRLVRGEWLERALTGSALYEFADATAHAMGWRLNQAWSGHRLSEFPHSAHYDGLLSEVGFTPAPGLWILEMHIRHPNRPFGAFFEDLLLEDEALQALASPGTIPL